jgi:hypothetical protein
MINHKLVVPKIDEHSRRLDKVRPLMRSMDPRIVAIKDPNGQDSEE